MYDEPESQLWMTHTATASTTATPSSLALTPRPQSKENGPQKRRQQQLNIKKQHLRPQC